MRNLLAFMMTVLLTVGGLGWYLEWFQIRTTPGTDGHMTLNIDLNRPKVYEDTAKAGAKISELAQKKAKETETDKSVDKTHASN